MTAAESEEPYIDNEGSSTSFGGDGGEVTEMTKAKREEIAKNETRALHRTRVVLLFVLLCSALLVSLVVYFYLANDENDDFEQQFRSDAHKIKQGLGSSLVSQTLS